MPNLISFLLNFLLLTVLAELNESGHETARGSMPSWKFVEEIPTKMYVSARKHVCWIFRRV